MRGDLGGGREMRAEDKRGRHNALWTIIGETMDEEVRGIAAAAVSRREEREGTIRRGLYVYCEAALRTFVVP